MFIFVVTISLMPNIYGRLQKPFGITRNTELRWNTPMKMMINVQSSLH